MTGIGILFKRLKNERLGERGRGKGEGEGEGCIRDKSNKAPGGLKSLKKTTTRIYIDAHANTFTLCDHKISVRF